MSKSSIHIKPVKPGSEQHNNRERDLDYVRKDLSHLNESWSSDNIQSQLKSITQKYTASVGRKMHSKSAPIREGVFLIKENTALKDCSKLADKLQERFGIRAFQMYLHKDEGHYSIDDKTKWIPNLHAHILFDWTDPESGKSIKLNRSDMSEMQSIVANELQMERGESSDKKHIDALAYKLMKQEEELNVLLTKYKEWEKGLLEIRNGIQNAGSAIVKKNLLGGVDLEKTLRNIESLLIENSKLKDSLSKSKSSNQQLDGINKSLREESSKQIEKIQKLKREVDTMVINLLQSSPNDQLLMLKKYFPDAYRRMNSEVNRGLEK